MQPRLNYDKHDPKFILLGKVFKFIENEKIKDIFNRYGVKNRNNFLIYLKIFFIHIFFNYNISDVVNELNRSYKLRKFAGILEVPSESQVYEYLSRYDLETYCNIVNSILKKFFKPHKRRKNTYITDATPVECDINILRKYISPKHLKKLRLKFGYSNSKGYFVGYKVTMIPEKNTYTSFYFNTSWCPKRFLNFRRSFKRTQKKTINQTKRPNLLRQRLCATRSISSLRLVQ